MHLVCGGCSQVTVSCEVDDWHEAETAAAELYEPVQFVPPFPVAPGMTWLLKFSGVPAGSPF